MTEQRSICLRILIAILIFSCGTLNAQTGTQEIEGLIGSFTQAFAKRDARELGKLMSDDVDFVNRSGKWMHGRSEVEKFFADGFRDRWQDSTLRSLGTSVRFLSPTLAVVHWKWILEGEKNKGGTTRRTSPALMTIVAQKSGNNWRILTVHASTQPSTSVADPQTQP